MASVRTDNGPNGKRTDFEATATHLLPYDPVAKKRAAGQKRTNEQISSVEADVSALTGPKPSIGKTGVHLRWHKRKEYEALTAAQKKELYEWREANPEAAKNPNAKGKGKGQGKYYTNKQLSSLVTKKVKIALEKNTEEQQDVSAGEAFIVSVVEKALGARANASSAAAETAPAKAPAPPTQLHPSALKSILKRAEKLKI